MTTVKKLLRSGVAALALAAAGTGVVQAQTYSGAYAGNMMQADLNVVDANYRSALASCNSRLYGGGNYGFSRALANGAEARACRADAQADMLDRVVQVQRRYNVPYTNTLRQAYNARVTAVRSKLESDKTRCSSRMVEGFNRNSSWQSRARSSADAQRCQANAEAYYYRSMASAERNYTSQIERSLQQPRR